jgi:uncharacterized membrane protein
MPTASTMPRLPRPLQTLLTHPRLSASTLLALVLAAALQARMGPARALLLSFDLASTVYLGTIGWMMGHSAPQALARRAERQLQGRWGVLVFSLLCSGVVLLALRLELRSGHGGHAGDLPLAAASIVLSWLFFSVVFAQAYAHADHLERKRGQPALRFPDDAVPDYWDYLYFSVVLSMTFQTSDVNIAGRSVRHIVLLHSVAAFFFNVFILALTVNVVAGAL